MVYYLYFFHYFYIFKKYFPLDIRRNPNDNYIVKNIYRSNDELLNFQKFNIMTILIPKYMPNIAQIWIFFLIIPVRVSFRDYTKKVLKFKY